MIGRLILLATFVVFALLIYQIIATTPPAQRKHVYRKAGLTIAAGLLIILAVTGKIHWIGALIGAVLPLLRRFLPLLLGYLPTIQHFIKSRPQPQSAAGNSSNVKTLILDMTMDHDTGRLFGTVISGPFAGRALDEMELQQLQLLLSYCHQEEQESAQLLINYLNHRFGSSWQQQTAQPGNDTIDRSAAYAILGLQPGATKDEIVQAHRKLMLKMHPDRGGSDYLASQINQAKDLLIKNLS